MRSQKKTFQTPSTTPHFPKAPKDNPFGPRSPWVRAITFVHFKPGTKQGSVSGGISTKSAVGHRALDHAHLLIDLSVLEIQSPCSCPAGSHWNPSCLRWISVEMTCWTSRNVTLAVCEASCPQGSLVSPIIKSRFCFSSAPRSVWPLLVFIQSQGANSRAHHVSFLYLTPLHPHRVSQLWW